MAELDRGQLHLAVHWQPGRVGRIHYRTVLQVGQQGNRRTSEEKLHAHLLTRLFNVGCTFRVGLSAFCP